MCTVLLPPGVNPIAVHKYTCISHYIICLSVSQHGKTRLLLDVFSCDLKIFENLSRKFNFLYSMARITGILHGDLCKFMIISCSVLLRMRNFPDRSRENQDTHFMFNKYFSENINVYEKMWKNTEPKQATNT